MASETLKTQEVFEIVKSLPGAPNFKGGAESDTCLAARKRKHHESK